MRRALAWGYLDQTVALTSMTGFATACRVYAGSHGPARLDVEIRAVNGRFLELKVRQPFGPELEAQFRRAVERKLGRGRVDLTVVVRRQGAEAATAGGALGLSPTRVRAGLALVTEIESAARQVALDLRPSSALELLRYLDQRQSDLPADPVRPPAFAEALVDEALVELCAFRDREGAVLHTALVELLEHLHGHLARLREDAPLGAERLMARHRQRLHELAARLGLPELDPERAATEVAVLAGRTDIDEELTRLTSHLAQVAEILEAPAQPGQGKTLDFLCQELQREVSTIGSKTGSHKSSREAIEARSTIERMREQVQNVE